MEYISVKAASEKCSVAPRRIQRLRDDGRIDGATNLACGGIRLIPKDAGVVRECRNRNIRNTSQLKE